MDGGFGKSAGPCSNKISNDIGDFECNICYELAEDPTVTLCGHLYCWSCLYKWLNMHSHSHECPVCKALIVEEKLVPIYGRGKTSRDPRCKLVPGVDIPNRPSVQRPETTSTAPIGANNMSQEGNGRMGGFLPMLVAIDGYLMFFAALGGLIPFLNLQVLSNGTVTGFPYRFPGLFESRPVHGFHHHSDQGRLRDSSGKLFLFLGIAVICWLIW